MSFLLFPSSGNHVAVEPNWDYEDKSGKVQSEHETRTGKKYVYLWGSFNAFAFSVDFVSSSDTAVINSWWSTNTKLLFMESGGVAVYSVMINAKTVPISKPVKPYRDQFKGKIELRGY